MGEYARERLNTDRVCADWQTVQRGTMQHEIFEGDDAVPFIDGATIRLKVNCRADAGRLDERVPYGLAVTLEAAEALRVPVYQEVAERINLQQEGGLRCSVSSQREAQASAFPFEGVSLIESLSRNRNLDFPEIDGRWFIHFVTKTFAKRRSVVRIDLDIVGRTRDGDVGKAAADEFRVNVRVHIHDDAFRCETLRAVRGYGITVIEVPHLPGIERHGSVLTSIHADRNDPIVADLLDIAFAVRQRDRNQRKPHISRGSESVAGQDAKSPTIGRHRRGNCDFHRKVCDEPALPLILP
jgi:hypothetical protein